jgi:hypothetical protein
LDSKEFEETGGLGWTDLQDQDTEKRTEVEASLLAREFTEPRERTVVAISSNDFAK